MNKKSILKNELIVNAICIIIVFVVFIGFSVGFFVDTDIGETDVISFGNMGMEFSTNGNSNQNYENNINIGLLSNPTSKEQALATTPYTFTVRNTGTLPLTITIFEQSEIILPSVSTVSADDISRDTIDSIYIALQEVGVGTPIVSKASDLTDGIVGITNLMGQQSKTYNVWTWIRDDAPNTIQGAQATITIRVRGEFIPYSAIETSTLSLITFDKQGGIGGTNTVATSYGEAMPSAEAPTKTGHTFMGYYSEPYGKGTKYYDSSMVGVRQSNIVSDKTLYAYWQSQFEQDSWATIVANVESGNTSNYYVGDTKEVSMGTLGVHILRIANKTLPSECLSSSYSQTACGFVLEFADIITTQAMRTDSNTNVGGWPALISSVGGIRDYVNTSVYNSLPAALKNAIVDTRVISGHGSTSGETNFISVDKLYLFSIPEIFGYEDSTDSLKLDATRQLDYYKDVGVNSVSYNYAIKKMDRTASNYALRSAQSTTTTSFRSVPATGEPTLGVTTSTTLIGVSPAFRLAGPGSFMNDSWETIVENVRNGNTANYNVGDIKKVDLGLLGTHTLRIANKTTTSDCSNASYSQTACGFVLEFTDIITKHPMRTDADINTGGWPALTASVGGMRDYLNSTTNPSSIYNSLPDELKEAIIDTRVISGYGCLNSDPENYACSEYDNNSTNFTSTDKIYLLSIPEIFGFNNDDDFVRLTQTRQLDYYRVIGVSETNNEGAVKQLQGVNNSYSLRSARSWSLTDFRDVPTTGDPRWGSNHATVSVGISPAFRLGS